MPRKRQPRAVWQRTRLLVLERDGYMCAHCHEPLTVATAHVDHMRSGKRGSNRLSNLRALCRRCHVLRADHRHQGMIRQALLDGLIPADWRPLVWDDY